MMEPSPTSNQSPMNHALLRRLGFGLLWLGFSLYAFVFAPPNQPDTFELIKRLSSMDITGINPLIVYLFNLMGVLPMLYSCVLYADGRGQKVPAWPFVAGSFFFGAFALLPYLVLRQSNPQLWGPKDWYLKIWDARLTGALVALAAMILLVLGVIQGNWSDFVQQWQSDRFIHVMSLDFCMLSLLFPALLHDDMARRGMSRQYFWLFVAIPLLGSLVYLVVRPPLPADTAVVGETT